MGTTHALLTFEEFERMPEADCKQELINGELIELPPAAYNHGILSEKIFEDLKAALQVAHGRGSAPMLGRVHHEIGYKLGVSWAVPDVSVTHANQKIDRYRIGAPAIAIEVVSPGNTAEMLEEKMQLYFEHGALEVWHFYPSRRYAAVFSGPDAARVIVRDTLSTPLLPGFELSIPDLLGK